MKVSYKYHIDTPINSFIQEKLMNFNKWQLYPYAASELKFTNDKWDWETFFKDNWSFRMALLALYDLLKSSIDNKLLTIIEIIELNKNNERILKDVMNNSFDNYKYIVDKSFLDSKFYLNHEDFSIKYILINPKIYYPEFEFYYKKYWYEFSYEFIAKHCSFELDINEYLEHINNKTKHFSHLVKQKKKLCLSSLLPNKYKHYIAYTHPFDYVEVADGNDDILYQIIGDNQQDLTKIYFHLGKNKNFTTKKETIIYDTFYNIGKMTRKDLNYKDLDSITFNDDLPILYEYVNNYITNQEDLDSFIHNYFTIRYEFNKSYLELLMPWIVYNKEILWSLLVKNGYTILSIIVDNKKYNYLAKDTKIYSYYKIILNRLIIRSNNKDLMEYYGLSN